MIGRGRDLLGARGDRRRVRDVQRNNLHAAARGRRHRLQRGCGGGVPAGREDAVAAALHLPDELQPQAAAGAGDECGARGRQAAGELAATAGRRIRRRTATVAAPINIPKTTVR